MAKLIPINKIAKEKAVWFEDKYSITPVLFISENKQYNSFCFLESDESAFFVHALTYNFSWRCWVGKPTKKERETAWHS